MPNVHRAVVFLVLGLFFALPQRAPSAPQARPVAPRLVSTLEIGGTSGETLFGDVDADGRPDVVTLRGGRVVVITTDGRVIYDEFVGATGLVRVADLDLDGHDDVVVLNGPGRALVAVDPIARKVRWRYVFPEAVTLDAEYVRIADLSASRHGLETVAFPDHSHTVGDAHGVFLDANGQAYATPVIRSAGGSQLNFPQLALGNIDATGDPEVVVVGRPKLLVYRSDGTLASELAFLAGDPEGRHYGTIQLANIDRDADLEAVVISDRVARVTSDKSHAIVVFDLAPSIREIWRAVVPAGHRLESIPDGIMDADGDGRADIAVNHHDGRTQAIEIFGGAGDSSRPGQPVRLARLDGAYAWDTWARAGSAPMFFASLERLAEPSMSYRSRLVEVEIARETAGGPIRLARRGDPIEARYAMRPLRALGREAPASSLTADRAGVVATVLPRGPAYVTYTVDAEGAPRIQYRLFGAKPEVIDGGARAGTVRAISPAGYLLVAGSRGEEVDDTLYLSKWDSVADGPRVVSSFRAGGFSTEAPVAVDLDADGFAELVVRTAGKRIVVFGRSAADGAFVERWSAASTTQPVADVPRSPGERPRVFIVAPTQRDRANLVALGSDGKALWETKFRDLPASARPEILVGEFTGAPPRDVWISAPRSKSWVVDGADGRIVWESVKVFSFSNRSAVVDSNDDGIDDIVTVGNYTYTVTSGRTGKPLVGPLDVRSMDGDLFATPVLAGDGTLALSSAARLAKARIGGKDYWVVERPVGRTNGALLPGLARNRTEVTTIGGNFGIGDRFVAYDYDKGRQVFSTDHVPITNIVTFDTDGDGEDEFVFGTSDGRVIALGSRTGVVIWSIDVGAFASTPSIERLAPNVLSLLVPLADGTIRIYGLS